MTSLIKKSLLERTKNYKVKNNIDKIDIDKINYNGNKINKNIDCQKFKKYIDRSDKIIHYQNLEFKENFIELREIL